ncbi:MAG: hypothetical protein V3575_03500 [Candidatus Absconditabacteria bacterium]
MLQKIVLFIMFASSGSALIYYSAHLVRIVGKWRWAEINLGGTRQAYVLVGFGLILIGFLILFGVLDITKGVAI